MPTQLKVEHLVVDTTAFIKNANLQDIATHVYTVQGVVDEIINKRQLRNLVVLPYDLKIKDVFPESICFVTEFSKKTGDYGSLSAVDIQVMALTHQLEKEHVGTDHLNLEPVVQRVSQFSETLPSAHLGTPGFYMPPPLKNKEKALSEDAEKDDSAGEETASDHGKEKDDGLGDIIIVGKGKICSEKILLHEAVDEAMNMPEVGTINDAEINEVDIESEGLPEMISPNLAEQLDQQDVEAVRDIEEALKRSKVEDVLNEPIDHETFGTVEEEFGYAEDACDEEEDKDDNIWDERAWITPENVEGVKRELQGTLEEDTPVVVACITGDFAMQNVIRQMGMKALAADGRIIKQLRTYILRCYSCFKTTSKVELLFCPHCGNRTLRRVAVLLKPDGTQEVQNSFRRPITARGKKFSLPKPQGGKHASNPILCPDQQLPQQWASKLARTKNNPLEPDYIAGFSPFVMRDVTSRSAMLGIKGNHTQVKNWMRKNPNEVVNKGKKKRK